MTAKPPPNSRRNLADRIVPWLVIALALVVLALAVNMLGRDVGLWDQPTRTVTLFCNYDQGKASCRSEPLRVER